MGEWILNFLQFDVVGVDFVMLDMLWWYGVEEVEYKVVVFDIMKYLCVGYWWQVCVQLIVILVMLLLWICGVWFMYWVDLYLLLGIKLCWWDYFKVVCCGLVFGLLWLFWVVGYYYKLGFYLFQLGGLGVVVDYLVVLFVV